MGVLQRSYTVRGLSDSLRDIAAGTNIIYVTTQDGFLLGASNGTVVNVDQTGRDQPLQANCSNNAVIAAIAREINLQGGCSNITALTHMRFTVNGSTFTVAVAQIKAGQRLWCGFAAIPSSEMMKTIEEGTKDSIVVLVCSIAVSVALALVLSVLLVSPLRNLIKDMQNLSKLRFKPVGNSVNIFTELHSMIRDYMAMKQGIHAFSKYVSAGVVRQLLDGNDKMSSLYLERHNVTVVFMDIVGFTSLCEKMAPNTLVTLMSVFMQRMCQVLIAEGATVDKFIGDCIMSFWNHPHPCEDHTYKAVHAVMRCFEELNIMNAENKNKGLPAIEFRAGINTGRVLVGNFGSPQRFDYTVLGDAVNVAARLEQLNKDLGTKILFSESVQRAIAGRLPIEALGEVTIRGREAKMDVYTVIVPACSD
ncbi:adenylate cyclase [Pelomyxa schiedti]|nr:adenylate cyclase [Pelomyxa schiedti]